MRIWLCKDTGAMNRPLRLAGCSLGVCVGVRRYFTECFVAISWINMAHLWSIHNIFAICLKCIHGVFATSSLSVCYIIAIQKHGFCNAKVWFLACKKGVFTLQKYGSCFCYAIVCITNNKVCVFRFLYLPLQLKRKLQRHNGRTPHCL